MVDTIFFMLEYTLYIKNVNNEQETIIENIIQGIRKGIDLTPS